jgi:hypothetical protein
VQGTVRDAVQAYMRDGGQNADPCAGGHSHGGHSHGGGHAHSCRGHER